MSKRTFYVRAIWDKDAGVFYSESDIDGLHIEAATIQEFEEVMNELARELIVANHISNDEFASMSIRDLLPAILWQRPENNGMVPA